MNPQRLLIGGLALAALVLGGIILVAPQLRPTRMLSGYIEGEPLYLAAPIAGQITALDVRRGDSVAAGAPCS